ncbi:hypothetical protein LX36DRAFT_676445, partial [Colletotrichum falcatum]
CEPQRGRIGVQERPTIPVVLLPVIDRGSSSVRAGFGGISINDDNGPGTGRDRRNQSRPPGSGSSSLVDQVLSNMLPTVWIGGEAQFGECGARPTRSTEGVEGGGALEEEEEEEEEEEARRCQRRWRWRLVGGQDTPDGGFVGLWHAMTHPGESSLA